MFRSLLHYLRLQQQEQQQQLQRLRQPYCCVTASSVLH
jgi:hypothetical protein